MRIKICAERFGRQGNKRHQKQQKKIQPDYFCIHLMKLIEHRIVIEPINCDHDKAQSIYADMPHYILHSLDGEFRKFYLKHHKGYDNCNNPVTEHLKPRFAHL